MSNSIEPGEIGCAIRQRRNALGMSQRQLSDQAGISIGCLRDLEQGRTQFPRVDSLTALASALGFDLLQPNHLSDSSYCKTLRDQEGPSLLGQVRNTEAARIKILGPLSVVLLGRPVEIRWQRDRTVLGLLALGGEAGVSLGELTSFFWLDRQPRSAVTIVQGHVSRLRRLFKTANNTPGSEPITWNGQVYRLSHSSQRLLDSIEFAELAEHGDAAAAVGNPGRACECYTRALRLWRGEVLADLDLQWHPSVALLNMRRSHVIVQYADAAASSDSHERALPYLRQACLDEPLSEAIHERLIVSLLRSGQRVEATRVFEQFRQHLECELGIAPGKRLWRAYAAVSE